MFCDSDQELSWMVAVVREQRGDDEFCAIVLLSSPAYDTL